MTHAYSELQQTIGYTFQDVRRLESALTHPSHRYERDGIDTDNQRLEFLGDAALGFVAAAYLYRAYPDMQEGALTTLRSQITGGKPLAEIAAACDVGRHLKLGKGERQSGGQERASNLTDALEAVIGAAYEDGGIDAVEAIFERLFVPYVKSVEQAQHLDNPKGTLQELAQQRWKIAPRYHVVTEEGPSHDRVYTVEIRLNNHVFGRGTASNKRDAQAEAARVALPKIEELEMLPADPHFNIGH